MAKQEMDYFLKAYSPDKAVNIISAIIKCTKMVYKVNSGLTSGDAFQAANINGII